MHLSDEEKLQVLLVALAVFLAALLAAICLAGADCPLQRWLLERHLRRRRRMLAPTSTSTLRQASSLPYVGPPPAYDAALRAARLEPLTLGKSLPSERPNNGPAKQDEQLQLGDYFHQPRDEQLLVVTQPTCSGWQHSNSAGRPPPVMLRLWVRMLDPAELVERVRATRLAPDGAETERKRSLSRQLSIPQLFGSLVGLTGSRTPPSENQATAITGIGAPAAVEPNSLASSSSSSTGSNGPAHPEGPIESRLLHMNVGSFSYVQEGAGLASAKKHQQLNRLQFVPLADSTATVKAASTDCKSGQDDKFCQLVISVCDIENALAGSRLNERSCALLAASSSLYVQCEILMSRSKSARLLRVLQPGPAVHTVELTGSSSAQPDGQAALVFTTAPRSLASLVDQAGAPDLIQFDSVFVTPILHKARVLDGGQIRLRLRTQCKHLNETCLAEVKLPLKQLLRSDAADNLLDVPVQPRQQADLVLNNVLANLESSSSGESMAEMLTGCNQPRGSTYKAGLQPSSSLDCALSRLVGLHEYEPVGLNLHCERALLVSHWLSHLLAPAYECRSVDEPCGRILLGITYLPTSNRVIFNAHRASLDNDLSIGRQLVKNLRLRSSTGYLLRFLMVLNGRVIRRKQTPAGRKPEWDSQEPITFDLANLGAERPSFVVALVARDASVHRAPFGSMQNLRGRRAGGESAAPGQAQSEPESPQRGHGWPPDWTERGRRDLVVGHATLDEECWRELRAQPRKQLVRQLKMY